VEGQPVAAAESSLQQLVQQRQGQGQKHPAAVAAEAGDMPVAVQQQQQAGCTRTAAAAALDAEELLRGSLCHWLWVVRSKGLLVRVFSRAEAAWQERALAEALDTLAAGEAQWIACLLEVALCLC
jgi:hypothetical protein